MNRKDVVLLHDNAEPHVSLMTTKANSLKNEALPILRSRRTFFLQTNKHLYISLREKCFRKQNDAKDVFYEQNDAKDVFYFFR